MLKEGCRTDSAAAELKNLEKEFKEVKEINRMGGEQITKLKEVLRVARDGGYEVVRSEAKSSEYDHYASTMTRV